MTLFRKNDAIRVTQLNHVGIHVDDVDRSLTFYRDLLGLETIYRPDLGFPGAWLKIGIDQELHLIGKNAQPDSVPNERHYAFRVDGIQAVEQALNQAKLGFEGPYHRPDGATQIFVKDPDGHVVELLELP